MGVLRLKYGEVSQSEYHTGIDALKWSLQQARAKVENCEVQLQFAKEKVRNIESDLRKILEDRN